MLWISYSHLSLTQTPELILPSLTEFQSHLDQGWADRQVSPKSGKGQKSYVEMMLNRGLSQNREAKLDVRMKEETKWRTGHKAQEWNKNHRKEGSKSLV